MPITNTPKTKRVKPNSYTPNSYTPNSYTPSIPPNNYKPPTRFLQKRHPLENWRGHADTLFTQDGSSDTIGATPQGYPLHKG